MASILLSGCAYRTPARDDPRALSWPEWIESRQSAYEAFRKSAPSALRRYRAELRNADESPPQRGKTSLRRVPGERLPRLVVQNDGEPEAEFALDRGVPEGFEPDLVRLSPSGRRAAVLLKNGALTSLCIYGAGYSAPECSDGAGIYDLAWGATDAELLKTISDSSTGEWKLVRAGVPDGTPFILFSKKLRPGYLLLKRISEKLFVNELSGEESKWFSLDLSSPAAALLPSPPPEETINPSFDDKIRSSDGTEIPIRFHRPPEARPKAIMLRFYGAYGRSLSEGLSPELAPFVTLGVLITDVGVRGGGELGKEWADAGSGVHRARAIDDLEAAIDFHVRKYPGIPIFLKSRSAGGVLAAIALHERPILSGAILEAPFVALDRWAESEDVPLEAPLWGDPRTAKGRESLDALVARMGNVSSPVYVWIGGRDAVVPIDWIRPWLDAKVARAVVRIDAEAGHDGPLDTAHTAALYAEEYAFIESAANETGLF